MQTQKYYQVCENGAKTSKRRLTNGWDTYGFADVVKLMTQTINLGDLKIHQANCKPRKLNSCSFCGKGMELNLFHATGHFLYSLKASENWFSDVFRGCRKRPVA